MMYNEVSFVVVVCLCFFKRNLRTARRSAGFLERLASKLIQMSSYLSFATFHTGEGGAGG